MRAERLNRGVFLATSAVPGCHTIRGGGVPRFQPTVWHFNIPISISLFCSYPLPIGVPRADPAKTERTIATPPKRRGSRGPHRGAEFHASIRPPWVAIVLNYPCGKARNRTDRSADRGGARVPFPSPWMIPDRSSPSRVRFAASRPGRLRADPKGWRFTRGKGGTATGESHTGGSTRPPSRRRIRLVE